MNWCTYFNGLDCPKLKSFTLESLGLNNHCKDYCIRISESVGLEALVEECKELENLKFKKCWFFDLDTKEEVEAKFPNCNVEFKNCKFGPNWDDFQPQLENNDNFFSRMKRMIYETLNIYLNLGASVWHWYNNSKSDIDGDENDDDVLDNFDGREIEFMFTQDEDVSGSTSSDELIPKDELEPAECTFQSKAKESFDCIVL